MTNNNTEDLKGKGRKVEIEEILEDTNSSNNDFSSNQIINFNQNKELIVKRFADKIEKEICQAEIAYAKSPAGLTSGLVDCVPFLSNVVSLVSDNNDRMNARVGRITDRKTLMIRNNVVNSLENTVNELGTVLINTVDIIKSHYNEEIEAYKTETEIQRNKLEKLTFEIEELKERFNLNTISDDSLISQILDHNPQIRTNINSTDLSLNPSRHLTAEQEKIIYLILNIRSLTNKLIISKSETSTVRIDLEESLKRNEVWGKSYLEWKEKEREFQKLKFNLELQAVRDKANIKELTEHVKELTGRPFFFNYLPEVSTLADNAIWSIVIGFLALFNLVALIKSVKIFIFTFFSSSILIGLKLFFPQKGNSWILKTAFYSYISIATFLIGIDLIRKYLLVGSKKEIEIKDENDKDIIDINAVKN